MTSTPLRSESWWRAAMRGFASWYPHVRLLAAVMIFGFTVVTALLLPPAQQTAIALQASYFALLAVVSLALLLLLGHHRLISDYRSLAIAAGATLFVVLTVTPEFRVLSDELNLVNVSKSLFRDHRATNVETGLYYSQNFHALSGHLDKRPIAFPFLVSLLHTLTGPRPENAFLANALILFLLLAVVLNAARQHWSGWVSVAAALLVIGQPAIALSATSAGFDLLFLFSLVLCLLLLQRFLAAPDARRLTELWVALLFFAYTRYECIGIALLWWASLYLGRKIPATTMARYAFLWVAAGLLLLPLICQQWVSLGDHQNGPGQALFGWAHFRENIVDWAVAFFDPRWKQAFSPLLSVMGFLALILFPLGAGGWGVTRPFLSLAAGGTLLQLGMILFHLDSFATHPNSIRFFLPLALLLAWAPAEWVSRRPRAGQLLTVVALGNLFLVHSVAMRGVESHSLTLGKEFRETLAFLEGQRTREVMVINDRSQHYTAYDYGAMPFEHARQNLLSLVNNLDSHLIKRAYVIQHVTRVDGKVVASDRLPPFQGYHLKTRYEFHLNDEFLTRVSEYTR